MRVAMRYFLCLVLICLRTLEVAHDNELGALVFLWLAVMGESLVEVLLEC